MQKNNITNKITPCCGLPFSVVYWWVSNLTLNSEADRQYLLTQISQSGVLSIDGWKVLVNSGTLEADANLTKPEFLAWFNCEKQPSCEQLKLIIEGYKMGSWVGDLNEIRFENVLGVLEISDPAPTTVGLYRLSEFGTYTNLGGLVTTAGKINDAYFDGTSWKLSEAELPNNIEDSLTSTSTTDSLSSNMGRVLNEKTNLIIKNSAVKFGFVGLHTTPMVISQSVSNNIVDITFNIPNYIVSANGNIDTTNITETKTINNDFGLYSLFLNADGTSGNKIVLKKYYEKIEVSDSNNYYFLGTLQIFNNGIDSKYLNINGRFIYEGSEYFNNTSNEIGLKELIYNELKSIKEIDMNVFLPEKIWLIDDENYTIFKDSVFFTSSKNNDIKTQIVAVTDTSINYGNKAVTFNSKDIDGYTADNGTNNQLGIYINSDLNFNDGGEYYGNKISIIKTSKSVLNNKTIKYTAIGDSMTDNGMVRALKHYFSKFNTTLNGIGLRNNNSSDAKGEGRSGWRYSNIIGRCNAHGWNAIERINPAGEIAGGVNITDSAHNNPFIRLATAQDKTNFGDWCFTNSANAQSTANYLEKSYNQVVSEGGNTSQNFYIFDIDNYYRVQHGWNGTGNPVDAISLAFSTNELIIEGNWLNDSTKINEAINRIEENLNWILDRINQQLPNVKVAIITSYAWAFDSYGQKYYNFIMPMIKRINNKVKAINTNSGNNNAILAPYMFMDRMYSYNRGNAVLNTELNGSTLNIYSIGDSIHFDSIGYMNYVKSIAGWLATV